MEISFVFAKENVEIHLVAIQQYKVHLQQLNIAAGAESNIRCELRLIRHMKHRQIYVQNADPSDLPQVVLCC